MLKYFTFKLFLFLVLVYECSAEIWKNDSKYKQFRRILRKSKHVLVITGPGISIESGIPTFQGTTRFWRNHDTHLLAHPGTFAQNPSLVWEYYNYIRELVFSTTPNKAHYAISEYERECDLTDRNFTLITQNIDGLHGAAASDNLIELHGNLFRTKCVVCGDVQPNYESPIRPVFADRRINLTNEQQIELPPIPASELPRCKRKKCGGLLRPDIVWFTEPVDPKVIKRTETALKSADVCLAIGISSVILPLAEFAPRLARTGVTVAEFNTQSTSYTNLFQFHFRGPYTETVPEALKRWIHY